MTQQAQAEALQTQQFLIARRSHLGSRKSMCDDNGKAAWDKYTTAADLIARQAGRIAELERTTQSVEIPNQPGLNIDLTRMREAALHAQVHGVVFKADGSQVRQVLDYLHERTLEIKRLNERIAELEAPQRRDPLPEAELDDLAAKHGLDEFVYEPFARDLERAHGIGATNAD